MRFLLLFLSLFVLACSGTAPAADADATPATGDTIIEVKDPVTLDDLLQRLPGVAVSGSRVLLRGRQPLFVLDGVPLGKDYSSVQRTVVPNDVAEVRALTNPVDTNRYGMPGANGVILISTTR